MDAILDKSKEFDYLVKSLDPLFDDLVIANEIVKQFIIDNKLIVYGGTAIDYALRLKGDKIYPDDLLKIPDLDFYSPKNVEHSYQLADILFARGYREARAINAMHMETMKVDVAANHFIADISYRPQSIFEKLPFLEWAGMRIIHPDFQRVDQHSALSFPYDDAPREVIFARWAKDIKRFNILASHYPIAHPARSTILEARPSATNIRGYVFTGFAAYSIIYNEFINLVARAGVTAPEDIIEASFAIDEADPPIMTFSTLNHTCEIVHFDIKKAAEAIGVSPYKHYEPYINLQPERLEGQVGESNIVIYSTKNRLIGANTIKVSRRTEAKSDRGHTLRITNIQFLLKYFLSMYFVSVDSPKLAATYLSRYTSLLSMINVVEGISANDDAAMLFYPTIRTYGNENINLAREVALNRLYTDLGTAVPYKIPANYYPARAKEKGLGHPPFTPRDLEFFREEGLEMI
jgi:hypothetical protein